MSKQKVLEIIRICEENSITYNVYTDKTGLLDVDKLDSCYKYGYNAVIENLDKIKDVIDGTNFYPSLD